MRRTGAKPRAFTGGGSRGLEIRNNIFVANHGGEIIKTGTGYVFENNAYYRTDGKFSVSYGDKQFISLAEWQTATAQETINGKPVGFFADPMFRNAGGGKAFNDPSALNTLEAYDLLPSSGLIGKGLDLRGRVPGAPGEQDFRGRPLQDRAATPSIGAVESPKP